MSYSNASCYHTKLPEVSTYFKEQSICETLEIPCKKPDMLRLLDVMVWPEIESYKVVSTQVGCSYEGQNLTGVQLSVDIRLKEKITYVADNCEQSVHAAHYESLESAFVVLPAQVDGVNMCDLITSKLVVVTPYIEAVDARMLDKRVVQKSILLLVDVKLRKNQKGAESHG